MHFRKTDMGTPLTGSSVASTYSSLLKTTDSTTFSATLKTICDGAGTNSSFQLASGAAAFLGTLDITGNTTLAGNFTVATNKFIVAAATGNTTVGGTLAVAAAATLSNTLAVTGAVTLSSTLAVTGAATLSSTLAVSSNISTSGGNVSVYGNIIQSNSAASSSIAGALTVGGATVFNGGVTFNSTTSFSSSISVAGFTNSGTLVSTGAATIGTVGGVALGSTTLTSATISGFLTVAGPSTFNGNTTLGDAAGDTVTVGAQTVTFSNLVDKGLAVAGDTFLVRDSVDSNKLKTVAASTVGAAKFIYSETIVKPVGSEQSFSPTPGGYSTLQQSGSTSDWSYTWTPKTAGNKALIKISVPLYIDSVPTYGLTSFYVGIVKDSGNPGDVIAVGAQYCAQQNTVVVVAEGTFTATAASHTFKVWIGSAFSSTMTVAKNGTSSWFNNNSSSQNAKVQFELIEF